MPMPSAKRTGPSTSDRIRELFRRKSDSDRNLRELLKDDNEDLLTQIVERVLESQMALDTTAKQGNRPAQPVYISASTQTETADEPMADETEKIVEETDIPVTYQSSSTQTTANLETPTATVDQLVRVALQTTASELEQQKTILEDERTEKAHPKIPSLNYDSIEISSGWSDYMLSDIAVKNEFSVPPSPIERATQQEPSHQRISPEPETVYYPKFIRVPYHGKIIRICFPPPGSYKERPQSPKPWLGGRTILKPRLCKLPRGEKKSGKSVKKHSREESGEDASDEEEENDDEEDDDDKSIDEKKAEPPVTQQESVDVHKGAVFHFEPRKENKAIYTLPIIPKGSLSVQKDTVFHFGQPNEMNLQFQFPSPQQNSASIRKDTTFHFGLREEHEFKVVLSNEETKALTSSGVFVFGKS